MLDVSVLPPLGTAKRAYALISWKFALKGEMVVTSRDRLDMRKGNFEKIRHELEKQDQDKLFLNKIYETDLAEKSNKDPTLVYSFVRSKQDVKEHVRADLNKNNELVTNRKEMAQILNEQFGSFFVVEPDGKDDELPKFEYMRLVPQIILR